jgi:hypothetical protein
MTSTGAQSAVTILVDERSGISVTGTLDSTTLVELKRMLTDFFDVTDTSESDVLTLDLATVSSCDHAVLEAVRYAMMVCAERSIALRVVPSEEVRRVMTAGR